MLRKYYYKKCLLLIINNYRYLIYINFARNVKHKLALTDYKYRYKFHNLTDKYFYSILMKKTAGITSS